MKKTIIFLIPFIVAACIPRATAPLSSVPRETVRQIETKAADISQAIMLDVKELDGYFLRNSVKLNDEVNFFTVSSQKVFDSVLGQSRAMKEGSALADLKSNIIAVIAMKPSRMANDIKVTKAYIIGSDIYIDYEINPKITQEVGYFISNIKVFEIQRPKQILNVSFVDINKKMTILPFGRRIAGSPVNLDALLKYYTGRYKGTIPVADGSGIAMLLTLSADYTFRLEQSYLNNPARTFESTGKWAPSDDLSFFVLNYESPQHEQMSFYFLERNTMEKLDINREKIDISPELYRLKK